VPDSRFLRYVVSTRCTCGAIAWESYEWLVLCHPESQRFQRAHPRIQFAGMYPIETDGRAALVTSYQSVADAARLDVVSAADDLQILAVHDSERHSAELAEVDAPPASAADPNAGPAPWCAGRPRSRATDNFAVFPDGRFHR
jgi:hypothetical protein